jgi:hypothetical protein
MIRHQGPAATPGLFYSGRSCRGNILHIRIEPAIVVNDEDGAQLRKARLRRIACPSLWLTLAAAFTP